MHRDNEPSPADVPADTDDDLVEVDVVGVFILLAAQGLCWFGMGLLVGRFVLGSA